MIKARIPRALVLVLLLLPCTRAEVRLASLFADHLVLQQQQSNRIWGWDVPGTKVTVAFSGDKVETVAGADGKWLVRLRPHAANSQPQKMVVSGTTRLEIRDVLVGEVWLASGQSNMVVPVDQSANANEEKSTADFPAIRFFKVEQTGSLQPLDSVAGAWSVCAPSTVGSFPGVAYFFAREVHQSLGVPIGILHSAWGATPAQAWTSREALGRDPDLKALADTEIATMERAPAEQSAFATAITRWESANGLTDGENIGFAAAWAAASFDDSGWKSAATPFTLASALGSNSGGIFWVRKAVDLPAESAGLPFTLHLGLLAEQYDTVYFNGEKVGSTGREPPLYYSRPRTYRIPGKLVHSGRNEIAARIVAHTAKGGLRIPKELLNLPYRDAPTDDDSWKICLERGLPQLSPAALASRPTLNRAQIHQTSAALFNGMIHPLLGYGIRGAIWYQGESNAQHGPDAERYAALFPALIADWRARWGEGDFPFYFVQLANYKETKRDHQESVWSLLREAQRQALAKSPNTGMAVAIDLGDTVTIHPKNKQDVGKRLALLARRKTYGEKGVVGDSPLFRSQVIEGAAIRVTFDTGGAPLMVGEKQGLNPVREVVGSKLQWFEIAGQDGTFVWAEAVIDGDCVVVSSPKIPSPVEVRYAWAENPAGCNLYNRAGLPASPFRTSSASKRSAEEPRPGKDSNSEKRGRMNALPKAP